MSRGPPDRVKFRVTAVTSEDPDHPVTEVHLLAPHSRGWQSEKFCSYPQDILIDLASATHVHQIQVLSHQHLISTKVDIHVMQQGTGAEWQKLGHFVFENNEKSGFSARELKTVKIDRKLTTKMKLSLSRGYVNKHNIYNQVGIISVNLIGWPESEADSDIRHAEQRSKRDHLQVHGSNRDRSSFPSSHTQQMRGGGSEKVENYVLESSNQAGYNVGSQELVSLALDAGIDPFVMHIVREAHKHKQKAVMKEDYEEARRLRDGIERLKLIGRRVAELEGVKQKAVEQEDYENAHVLKKDIDKLRQSCVSLGIGKQGMQAAQAVKLQQEQQQAAKYNYPKPKIIGGGQSFSSAQSKLSALGRRSSRKKEEAALAPGPSSSTHAAPTKKELFRGNNDIDHPKPTATVQEKAAAGVGKKKKEEEVEVEEEDKRKEKQKSVSAESKVDTSTSMTPPASIPKAFNVEQGKGEIAKDGNGNGKGEQGGTSAESKGKGVDSGDDVKSKLDGPKVEVQQKE